MPVAKSNMFSCNSTRVVSSSSLRKLESKDTNLKKRVLLNSKSKSTSKDVKRSQSSVSLVSNKRDTLNSTISESNINVLKAKTVNAVNDGSNLVCVSCGKDFFMISHDKCVARYALFPNYRVIRALFTSLVASKSSKLGATPVVAKSSVVERRIQTLVEAARTMLIFSKSLEFLWAEAIATACFTQNRSLVHMRYNKIPYELIKGRKLNAQYFHVFGSLCYSTNDHDDLGKMKPKADIEPIANEPTTPVSDDVADESVQEDIVELDINTFINPFHTHVVEEAESSSTYQDPSNMHEFYQKHCSTNTWTKNHPLEQVIGDPSKLVMTRSRLHADAELCMYALTVSTTEPTNIKEAMLDHNWIESIQDKLNQFKILDV
ncbi:retrovirus-related pol polyprotein from transposon TNT 1-94 [Tanacetum coccineum]